MIEEQGQGGAENYKQQILKVRAAIKIMNINLSEHLDLGHRKNSLIRLFTSGSEKSRPIRFFKTWSQETRGPIRSFTSGLQKTRPIRSFTSGSQKTRPIRLFRSGSQKSRPIRVYRSGSQRMILTKELINKRPFVLVFSCRNTTMTSSWHVQTSSKE